VENYEDILAEETVEVEITRPDVTTFFENYLGIEGIKLIHKTDAYYSPKKDLISIPKMMSFVSEDAYYSTLAHEVIHSTGVEKRLHRFDDGSFREGREKYSQEELVAEIGSAYLCSDLGIEVDVDNSASYLNSWAKYLKESKKTAIFSASKQSEKAVAYVKDKANTKQQAA
jgi:antirestriction protein ArdC